MASSVEICNKALQLLGTSKPLTSLADDTKAGRACNRVYDPIRLLMLQGHPWNFAMKRSSLPALVEVPAWGFALSYQVPSDALFVKEINSTEEWKIEGDKINTDEVAPLGVFYMQNIEDHDLMTPLFREALSARVAVDIAYDLTGNATLLTNLKAIYDERLSGARTNDAQEGTPDAVEQGAWLDSRI